MAIQTTKGKPGEGMTFEAQGPTPGPWQWGHRFDGFVVYSESGNRVTMVAWKGGRDRTEANARLIAAAPELLEALAKTIQAYDDAGNWVQDMNMAWIDDARAAFAKATGKGE